MSFDVTTPTLFNGNKYEIKAISDIIVTSSNAKKVVDNLPKDAKIIFGPDKNLGSYINSVTGRNMILWDGSCHVHKRFDLNKILELKKENPDAKIISHPECEKPILLVSDFVGSTAAMLKYTSTDSSLKFIVVTESGILYKMKQNNPGKVFIAAPPSDENCACNERNSEAVKNICIKKNGKEVCKRSQKYGASENIRSQ